MTTDAPRRLLPLDHIGDPRLDGLVDVINALGEVVGQLADEVEQIYEFLDLVPTGPPMVDITVRDELL